MLAMERQDAFDDPAWLFELKYDGYRLLAETGGRLRFQTRNGHEATAWFPELHKPLLAVGGRHVLDGEVCVMDDMGRPHFERLHARAARRGWRKGDALVTFCVFDILVLAGKSVMRWPLEERKAMLMDLLGTSLPSILPVQHIEGEGKAMYQFAVELLLEGVVAKRRSSCYLPGARSPDWQKIKRPGAVPPERFRR